VPAPERGLGGREPRAHGRQVDARADVPREEHVRRPPEVRLGPGVRPLRAHGAGVYGARARDGQNPGRAAGAQPARGGTSGSPSRRATTSQRKAAAREGSFERRREQEGLDLRAPDVGQLGRQRGAQEEAQRQAALGVVDLGVDGAAQVEQRVHEGQRPRAGGAAPPPSPSTCSTAHERISLACVARPASVPDQRDDQAHVLGNHERAAARQRDLAAARVQQRQRLAEDVAQRSALGVVDQQDAQPAARRRLAAEGR
jgi:hypothetical protein